MQFIPGRKAASLLWSSVFVTRVSNQLMSNISLRMAYDIRYKFDGVGSRPIGRRARGIRDIEISVMCDVQHSTDSFLIKSNNST